MALLILPCAVPVQAGEKATISVPRKPSTVNPAATRPAETFRPLDPGSTPGRSSESAVPPIPITPNQPDARTQKEMIERLDRQRNWILEDPERFGKNEDSTRWLPNLEDPDYTTNPRRPQTALGRHLKPDNSASRRTTESSDGRFSGETDRDRAARDDGDLLGSGLSTDAEARSGLTPSWTTPPSGYGPLLDQNSTRSAAFSLPGDRPMDFGRPGRGLASGLDPYSRERLDRYDRVFSGDNPLDRSSALGDSAERLRQRELRTELSMPAMRNPSATPPSGTLSGEDSGLTAAPLTRSGAVSPVAGVTAANNPYLPPLKATEPYQSPAAKMLKTPPVQPPRFRP